MGRACLNGWHGGIVLALAAHHRLRLSLYFQLGEPGERFIAARAAHVRLRLQTGTTRRPLRLTEDRAAQILAELYAAHTCRLAIRHARDWARNRRRDTARAAIGAASVTAHIERGLALQNAVRHITHDIFPELENRQHTTQRQTRIVPSRRVRPFYTIRREAARVNLMDTKGHAQEAFVQFDPVLRIRRLAPLQGWLLNPSAL